MGDDHNVERMPRAAGPARPVQAPVRLNRRRSTSPSARRLMCNQQGLTLHAGLTIVVVAVSGLEQTQLSPSANRWEWHQRLWANLTIRRLLAHVNCWFATNAN